MTDPVQPLHAVIVAVSGDPAVSKVHVRPPSEYVKPVAARAGKATKPRNTSEQAINTTPHRRLILE